MKPLGLDLETTQSTLRADYDLPKPYTVNGVTRIAQKNKFEAANISIDHFSTVRYPWFSQPAYTTDPMSPSQAITQMLLVEPIWMQV
jgi:hypothetical protein